mgnify:CR=1 FL=1
MTTPLATRDFPWVPVSLLGWLTIVAYGTWSYAFGVLLEPIKLDTGWPEGLLVSAFSASSLAGALLAPQAGRLIDRHLMRMVLGVSGLASCGLLLVASTAETVVVFAITGAAGGALLSAFAYYHVTQTLAVRLADPADGPRAVGLLTLIGAFSSTIYLPLTAWFVDDHGWRVTMRFHAVVAAVVLVLTALALPRPAATSPTPTRGPSGLMASERGRRYAVASAGVGVAVGAVLVYQVPIMVAAGLSLTTAAWLAGARGVMQFVGRLPVVWVVGRLGSTRSLQAAFGLLSVGIGILAFSSNPLIGAGYVVIGGIGIGATSPLQGIHSTTVFAPERLGQGMGTISLIFGVSLALGPLLVSLLNTFASVRWTAPSVGALAAAIAVVALHERSADPKGIDARNA